MISFPVSFEELSVADGAVVRAGGTDLQERLRSHNSHPDVVDLTSIDGFGGITEPTTEVDADATPDSSRPGVRIGAGTRLAVVARELADSAPALALTAGSLATPQIRARATLGGNLTQRTRCWYYRHPDLSCYKSGGDTCPARTGEHGYGVVFDRAPCVHPHPSSMAMALLTYDATVCLTDGRVVTVEALYGDGVDPSRDHKLGDGDVIASITVPMLWTEEHGAYFRAISRFEAEWPLVESVARARFDGDTVAEIALGLGGVATVPLRCRAAEALRVGSTLAAATLERAALACTEGAQPLGQTGYKVQLVVATVQEVLERLRSARRP